MTAEKLWTVNTIKDAMRAAGSHWWDPDTMRYFGTKVLPTVYQGPGGVYFVTSEQPPHGKRAYTVRGFDPATADISTAGKLASMGKAAAISLAKRLAGEGAATTDEAYLPISVRDQFAHDLQKHTNPARGTETATVAAADALMKAAKLHHRYMVLLCSDEAFCRQVDEDGEHPRVVKLRAKIAGLAKSVGCAGVVFSGDPRGCTVKLTFKDGFTNDFGGKGYCVPSGD